MRVTSLFIKLFFVVTLSIVLSCTDIGPISLEKHVHFADHIAYGKVMERLPDPNYGMALANLFSVKFRVYCTYKGTPLNATVFIFGAGHMPGRCFHTRLKVGRKYVVLLNVENERLVPASGDIAIGNLTEMDPLLRICDLDLQNPGGTQSVTPSECPLPDTTETCLRYDPNATTSLRTPLRLDSEPRHTTVKEETREETKNEPQIGESKDPPSSANILAVSAFTIILGVAAHCTLL